MSYKIDTGGTQSEDISNNLVELMVKIRGLFVTLACTIKDIDKNSVVW
jgi:hypothetical protein